MPSQKMLANFFQKFAKGTEKSLKGQAEKAKCIQLKAQEYHWDVTFGHFLILSLLWATQCHDNLLNRSNLLKRLQKRKRIIEPLKKVHSVCSEKMRPSISNKVDLLLNAHLNQRGVVQRAVCSNLIYTNQTKWCIFLTHK